jgi:multicomponent Na+:H+ antiporter subunit B
VSEIVRTVTRWISAFIALYGLYLVAYGHLTPGGGFPGGVMIAGGYILLVLAFGRPEAERSLGLRAAKTLDSVAALLFLLVAVSGLTLGKVFFENFVQKASPGSAYEVLNSGTIPIANMAIAVKVATSLFAVFAIMATVRFVQKDKGLEFTGGEE